MTIRWRALSMIVFAAIVWVALAFPASAQDYPNRTIRMIVPFGAGGPTDVFTRALGEELRKSLGQPIVHGEPPRRRHHHRHDRSRARRRPTATRC